MKLNTLFFAALVGTSTFASSALADAGHSHGAGIGEPGRASEADRTVEVTMHDNYFEPETLSFSKGETVRFIVHNTGQLVHEFNIGTAAMHAKHQEEMMMMQEHGALHARHIDHEAMQMDMGDGHTMAHDDPNSVLLEPGQSGEIVWRFSVDTDLEFACNVPGHYMAGMVGEIDVQL